MTGNYPLNNGKTNTCAFIFISAMKPLENAKEFLSFWDECG